MTQGAPNPLFLSRLLLDPRSRQVGAELAQPYEMHRTLLKAFPSEEDGSPGRVLFRVEEDLEGGAVKVLVQSEKRPDWSYLKSLDSYLATWNQENPATKEVYPFVRVGQRLCFRLRANPTKRRNTDKRRLGIFQEKDQIEWLRRKGERGGFLVVFCRVLPKGKCDRGVIHRGRETHRIHLLAALFEGVLEVTDTEAFLGALSAGIGSGKAFGFGLLSVAPYGGEA